MKSSAIFFTSSFQPPPPLFPNILQKMYTFFFFHYFQKMYKRFFNPSSGRDKGTIYHMKVLVQRSNVNGKVKSRFEVSYK